MDMRVAEAPAYAPPLPPRPARPPSVFSVLLGAAARNPVTMWPEAAFHAPHVTRNLLGVRYHAISDPDLIRQVLVERAAIYRRPQILGGVMASANGGLIVADGEDWKRQRRLLAPAFTPAAVEAFLPLFQAVADQAEPWAKEGPEPIDIAGAATRTAFAVIARALFTTGLALEPDATTRHVRRMMAAAASLRPSGLAVLSLIDGVPRLTPGIISAAVLGRQLKAFMAERRRDPDPPDDFVSRLMAAFAADRLPKDAERQTLANALGFLAAGHETTASALAFTLYLLAHQPEAQAWAAEEARAALDARTPAEALGRLVYLRWVLEEALRLYPPGVRLERKAAISDRLGDLEIRRGDLVSVWPWIVHRHHALWRRPDVFDPENFAPEQRALHHRFQYLPFGAGPRVCIGGQFATAEALTILSRWLARYEFRPAPGHALDLASDITLKPKGALPLLVRPR